MKSSKMMSKSSGAPTLDVRDQRQVDDSAFLGDLRIAGQKNPTAAAVARHFRTRGGPAWPFYMHGTAWLEIDGRGDVMEKADGLLKNRFKNSWPSYQWADAMGAKGSVDWAKAFAGGAGSIGRTTFVPELTTAWALTGRRKYLRKAFELMESFVEAAPFVLEDGFEEDHDRYFGGDQNHTLTVGYRCLRWIDFLHSGALQVPGLLSDDEVVWFVKQIWFYARQYFRFVGDAMRRDNHHLVDHGHIPFVLGTMFPEFSFAAAMQRYGRKTIGYHFSHNIFADGGYAEHSTKYQYHILFHYLQPLALARANGHALFTGAQFKRLAKWVEFSARAAKPNGILADFGDEYGGSLAYFFASLAVPMMDRKLAAMSRALGFEPGQLVGESPAKLTAESNKWAEGTPTRVGLSPYYTKRHAVHAPVKADLPTPASIQYPNGGYTFFRSSWTKDADFLGVAHYTDSMPHGHAHWDMMSFVLHSQGQTLIGDPATWIYTSPGVYAGTREAQEMRGYHYAANSHNCLIMNDDTLKPLAALGHGCCWGGYPPKHGLGLFKAGGPIELMEVWHDAYAPSRHRRFVVHLRDLGGFVFIDTIWREGLDLRPHQYSQLYHFEKDVKIKPEAPKGNGGRLKASRDGASCLIIPGVETETSWKTWRDPFLDKANFPFARTDETPWVAELTRRQQGPTVLTTFILTRAASQAGELKYLGREPAKAFVRQHEGISAHSLDLGRLGRLLVASCPYGQSLNSPELTTDAELAVVLQNPRGQVTSWALARGSRLEVNGRRLVRRKTEWAAE